MDSNVYPMAAIGEGKKLGEMRKKWAAALSSIFNSEGYIVTEQHDGTAHAEGWPFPLWHQGDGIGWHFVTTGIPSYDGPSIVKPGGWKVKGGVSGPVNPQGWEVNLNKSFHAFY
jgi:hypothetical protein